MEQRVPFQCAGYFLKNLLHPPPCLPLPSLMNLQRPSSQGRDGLLITDYVESAQLDVDTEILSQSAEDQLASKLKLAQIEFSYRRASELQQRPD